MTNATSPTGLWCDRCGEPVDGGGHPACQVARELEPPRFCPRCRRRMKVQVLPSGWSATCVEHGTQGTHGTDRTHGTHGTTQG
ncbi:biotin synthase auxiliary protein BsaP [Plantactinospora alkalitolerans]|uniref:biotin synthase auxiliary protein BsaP n=1 Tax=Plantactinospora alkalitolerans TaxID=2789879 RepID=UPI0018AC93A9|nr:hypothetical protein [Plantactinospora alkalitolerans]